MRLLSLDISNFLSIGRVVLSLAARGLIGLEGRNTDSSACDSNGSGKSALIEALVWGLYGQPLRAVSVEEVVRTGSGGASVSVEFETQSSRYLVHRQRSKGKALLQLRDLTAGADLTRLDTADTQKEIQRLLGMDYDGFCNVVVYGKAELNRFTSAGDADRKRILETMLGIEVYESCLEEAKRRSTAKRTVLDLLYATLAEAAVHIDSSKHDIARLWTQDTDWEHGRQIQVQSYQERLKDYDKVLLASKEQAFKLQGLMQSLSAAKDELHQAQSKCGEEISDLTVQLGAAASTAMREEHGIQQQRQQLRQEHDLQVVWPLRRDLDKLSAEDAAASTSLERIRREGTFCDTCQQPISQEHTEKCERQHHQDSVRRIEQRAALELAMKSGEATLSERMAVLVTRLEASQRAHAMTQASLRGEIDSKKSQIALRAVEHERALTTIRQEVGYAQTALREAEQRVADLNQLRHEQKSLEAQVSPFEIAKREAKQRLSAAITRRDETESRRHAAEQDCTVARFWVDAFGRAGIRSYVLDSVVPQLNARVSELTDALTGGDMTLEFSSTTKNKKGESSDKFSLAVTNRFGAQQYEGNSEGEKRRVDLCVLLALHELARSRVGQINILFIDEVFDVLDETGSERALQLLQELLTRGTGLESIFVVTHNSDLAPLFPERVVVQKSGGVSVLAQESVA